MRRLTLLSGALRLEIAPETGGAIVRFDRIDGDHNIEILRGFDGASEDARDLASFPLVPFSNRIRGGSFSFRGRKVTLPANIAGDPSPIHGQGWQNPWEVARAADDEADLIYRHPAAAWPWNYEARQRFRLQNDALEVELSCANLSPEPMPCGLGQHPYFRCTDATRIDAEVTTAWTIDKEVLPVEEVPATGRYDLRDRAACGQDLDNGFGGWSGRARITDPSLPFAIELSSPDASFFQLYSPPSGGIFVAEPVSHANAALNAPEEQWDKLGLRILEPGEAMTLAMRIALIDY